MKSICSQQVLLVNVNLKDLLILSFARDVETNLNLCVYIRDRQTNAITGGSPICVYERITLLCSNYSQVVGLYQRWAN